MNPTMCSILLLPRMLGGVTPSSVIREIWVRGWTLCQNYGAASQRHAHGRFVLSWKIWWILARSLSSPSIFTIKSTESWHLVVSTARIAREFLVYMYLENISYWQVNWDSLKLYSHLMRSIVHRRDRRRRFKVSERSSSSAPLR